MLMAASLLGWYPEPSVPGLPAFEGVLMARIRVCGVCLQPVRDCICEDDGPQDPAGDDGSEDEAA